VTYSESWEGATYDFYNAEPQQPMARSFRSAPIVVYLHGGYLLGTTHLESCQHLPAMTKQESAWFAKTVAGAGASLAVVEYPLPAQDMDAILEQCRTAVAHVCLSHPERPVYLLGHGIGAQLCAMALATSWEEYGCVAQPLSGAMLVSGIYDLEPVRLCSTNTNSHEGALQLSAEGALRCSPLAVGDRIQPRCPVVVAVAQHDSPEFRRQAEEFVDVIDNSSHQVKHIVCLEVDHFSIIEQLVNPSFILTHELVTLIRGSCH